MQLSLSSYPSLQLRALTPTSARHFTSCLYPLIAAIPWLSRQLQDYAYLVHRRALKFRTIEEHLVGAYPFIRSWMGDTKRYAWKTISYLLNTIHPACPWGGAICGAWLCRRSKQMMFKLERTAREEAGLKDGYHRYELVFELSMELNDLL
ncbi:hypothetical protein V8B97DRAFT_1542250 [Scleroderma yunnanense]